jgi:hypothetical protein
MSKAEYLIRKSAYWYRPNCNGYTTNPAEAGRYTFAQAVSYTHPNGFDGSRDGLSYVLESEVPIAIPAPSGPPALVKAVRAMLGDYQTSAEHHPDHVLVRLNHFDALRAALAEWERSSA